MIHNDAKNRRQAFSTLPMPQKPHFFRIFLLPLLLISFRQLPKCEARVLLMQQFLMKLDCQMGLDLSPRWMLRLKRCSLSFFDRFGLKAMACCSMVICLPIAVDHEI
jgi:hypothetical protein